MTACSAVTFMLREAAKDVSRCRCECKRLLEGRLVFEHAPKALWREANRGGKSERSPGVSKSSAGWRDLADL